MTKKNLKIKNRTSTNRTNAKAPLADTHPKPLHPCLDSCMVATTHNRVDGLTGFFTDEVRIPHHDVTTKPDPNFLSEFIELEHYVRGIYVDLVDGATFQNTQLSVKQMINKLIEISAFSNTWRNSKKLDALIAVRNKLVHGSNVDNHDLDIIQSSRFDISRLKSELIEDYTFFVTKRFLKTFELVKDTSSGFDFVASNDQAYVLFDVRYAHVSQKAARNVNDIIDKYTNYSKSFSRNSYYVLFYYQPNGRKSYDEFYSQFFDVLKNRFPEISDRFFIFYTSEYRW